MTATTRRIPGVVNARHSAVQAARIRHAAKRAATILHTPSPLPPLDDDYLAAEAAWETWRRWNGDDT